MFKIGDVLNETYRIEGKGDDQTLTLTAGENDDTLYPMVFHRAS